MTQVTNETILTAISELSNYVKTLSADMIEVKQEIVEIKEEMKRMNEKIDENHKVTKSFDRKIYVLNDEVLTMRADIVELQRAK
ncbi:hypothetical protein ACFPRA_16465 [Sporosarcina soli]|uniref:Uncharacterized protein n=1 Tax=Sporosarcina soli TaxID=334736 RepID=A0ABW0TLV4_9BACL